MLRKLVEYHWAEYIDDALLLLGRLDTKTVPLAGGTYLLSLQDDTIEAVVDLRDLELAYVNEDQRSIHIGSMTTLQSIVDAPSLKEFAQGLLAHAAQVSSSSRLIRQCATLGGTLGAGMASQADLLTALVALDAEAVVRSGTKTQVNLSGGTLERPGLALSGVVYKGKQERRIPCISLGLDRRPGELIIEVIIPCTLPGCGTSLLRVGRTPTDAALLNVAALVEIDQGPEEGIYKRVRLAFGGLNMEPVRLHSFERAIEGQPVGQPLDSQRLFSALRQTLADFRPPTDSRVSNGYRRVSGTSMAYRAILEAANMAFWRNTVLSESTPERGR